MNALIHQFPAARQLWVRPPLAVVAHAPTVAIASSNEHQITKGARLKNLPRFENRRMKTMIEPHSHADATLNCKFSQLIDFARVNASGLFHQHRLPGADRG